MNGRKLTEMLEQARRILLLAAGGRKPMRPQPAEQLALPLLLFGAEELRNDGDEPDLLPVHDRIHALGLEIILLIQMETAALVESPVSEGQKRRRLGGRPSLRLLDEWVSAPPLADDPWVDGQPASNREAAYVRGLGRVRALASALELTRAEVEEIVARLHPLARRAGPEDDLPGLLHGHGMRHALVRSARGRPAFRLDRQRSRGTGVLYTPAELVEEVARAVLDPAGHGSEEIFVCDPACGSGQFLMAAARRLVGREPQAEQLGRLLQLHGVDLDPSAARLAAHNLSLFAARSLGASQPGPILDELLGGGFPYFLGSAIQTGNSLLVEASTFSPGFLWERRFPRAFDRENPGFDVVVGNPPWISFGLRDRDAAGGVERDWYERLFPAGAQYKLSLYPLFMELALRLCRVGGHHGFLVPDSLLAGHHFSRIRDRLLGECDLLELSLIESAPWPGANTGFTVFYAARRKGGGTPAPLQVRNRVLKARPMSAEKQKITEMAQLAWAEMHGEPAPSPLRGPRGDETVYERIEVLVPAEQYRVMPGAPLRIFRERGEIEFLTQMQRCPLRFQDVAWSYSGLIARYGQKTMQSTQALRDFALLDKRGSEIYRDRDSAPQWRPALLSGSEVLPYRVQWRGGRVYVPSSREDLPTMWKSGFDLDRYQPPKIFLRQTGDRLIAAIDHEGYFCLNNLHLLGTRERSGIPALILLGVLLSDPLQRLYRIYSPEVSRPLAQVDLKIVESLPYPTDPQGGPLGAAPPPPKAQAQARRALRTIERALLREDTDPVCDLFETAFAAAGESWDGGPHTGREIVSLILLRVLQAREEAAAAPEVAVGRGRPAFLQELLDQCLGRAFGLPAPHRV